MIESNIVNWIDLGDTLQNLDVYSKKHTVKYFNFVRVLMSFKTFGVFCYMILKFLFFLQIMMLTLTNLNDDNDSAIVLLKYISTIIFIQDIVKSKQTYTIAIIVNSALTAFHILCIIYIAYSIKIRKFYLNLPIYLFNFINILITNYLIGPIVQISLLSTNCREGIHVYLNTVCYSDIGHIFVLIISMINLVFFLLLSVLLSIYFNEIGSVNENKVSGRINCNYEIYMNISKISMFVFAYIISNFFKDSDILRLAMQLFVFVNSIFFTFYSYFTVMFYDNKMNVITIYGWSFVAWFAFIIMLKDLLNIYDTCVFHVLGWVVISFVIFFAQSHKEEYLLTDFNIFEAKSLKDIELFNVKMFNLINIRSVKNKTMLLGLIEKFEGFFKTAPEMNEKYHKLCNDSVLKSKFNSSLDLPILSIVYLIYEYHLEKSAIKNDVLLVMVYFLMNKFKKVYLAISLCSKIKVTNHKQSYFKYILMEEIKEYLSNKITKSNNKESIKHVQIGSVILYNIYTELFRLKIYDAACNQIDYFDILRNNTTNSKTTRQFLKLGREILRIRKEILKLWQRILELNPFSDESERDYMLYLETIMQDDLLAKSESKRFLNLKTNKLSERNNIYHSMFRRDISTVVLIDGYSVIGRLLYASPNFAQLFGFSGKEVLNLGVEDLMPNVISVFHKELIDNAVRFSSINKIFKGQKDMLLKGKTGGIYNVKMYIKCVPNFEYGLLYMVYITKIQENNFIIVLDEHYRINALTDLVTGSQTPYVMNNNYGLTNSVIGHNVAMVIPEILRQMEYKDGKFSLIKTDIDLKGNLYPVSSSKELDMKIDIVYEKIKQTGRLANEEDLKKDTVQEYEELLKVITNKYNKPFSVFYRLATHTFLNNAYKYHRLYVTNDLIALNENSHFYNSSQSSQTQSERVNFRGNNENNDEQYEETANGGGGVTKNNSNVDEERNIKKVIRLKGIGFDSEKKELLQIKQSNICDGEITKKNKDNDELNNSKLKQTKDEHYKKEAGSSSIVTKSSIDSSSFNKLKNGILEKKEVTAIKVMKYTGISYGFLILIFIYLSFLGSKSTFESINTYLDENLFFNHSKISISCIYLSTINLNWVNNLNNIATRHCYMERCDTFYTDLLRRCVIDTKTQKANSSFFDEDYKHILSMSKELTLSTVGNAKNETIEVDMENLLTLIVSTGLDFTTNINEFFKNDSLYTVMSSNLIEQSETIINDVDYVGFDEKSRKHNVSKKESKLNVISLICAIVLFVVIMVLYSILVFQLYKMESMYLYKLIHFKSPGFEYYVKKLEELKKKLRNDNENEDEDEKNNDSLMQGGERVNGVQNESDNNNNVNNNNNNNTSKGKKKEKNKKNNDSKEDKVSKKKKREKNNKLQQLKDSKFDTMSKSFFISNLYFVIRGVVVFIISLSYFLVVSIIQSSYKNDFLLFDNSVNAIEGVYKKSFDVFLFLKNILRSHIDSNFQNEMTLLQNNEITTPKLGNLLMPLLNDKELTQSLVTMLNELYNSNACDVLFGEGNEPFYSNCSSFWSSILQKGMEQSITQMGVIINSVIDEFNAFHLGSKTIGEILAKESSYSQYEFFVEYYLLLAFWKSSEIFDELKTDKLERINKVYLIILIVYIIVVFILMTLVIMLVYSTRDMLNSFLNFIGILPIKYIYEDDGLYKDILKLEQKIY